MSQIALVSNQHDNDVGIGVIPEFFQPSCDIFVGDVLRDIVNQQCSDGATVIGGCDCAVSFLPRSIPNLCLDGFGVDLDASRSKFYTDCRLGIQVELVTCESAQKVGLSDTGVSDKDNWTTFSKARQTDKLRRDTNP
jgi:hypothetical protein